MQANWFNISRNVIKGRELVLRGKVLVGGNLRLDGCFSFHDGVISRGGGVVFRR